MTVVYVNIPITKEILMQKLDRLKNDRQQVLTI